MSFCCSGAFQKQLTPWQHPGCEKSRLTWKTKQAAELHQLCTANYRPAELGNHSLLKTMLSISLELQYGFPTSITENLFSLISNCHFFFLPEAVFMIRYRWHEEAVHSSEIVTHHWYLARMAPLGMDGLLPVGSFHEPRSCSCLCTVTDRKAWNSISICHLMPI